MASYNNHFTFAPDSRRPNFHSQPPPPPPPPPGFMPGSFAFAQVPVMDPQLIFNGIMNYDYTAKQPPISTQDTRIIAGMPIRFYENPPPNSRAIFSTKNGKQPFRYLNHFGATEFIPPLIVRSKIQLDINIKIKALKDEIPQHIIRLVRPLEDWHDLFEYFDVVDLCIEGPQFLFKLIQQLLKDIDIIDKEFNEEAKNLIDDYAQEWVEDNQERLIKYRRPNNVIDLFDNDDKKNIEQLTPQEHKWLRESLNKHGANLAHKLFMEKKLLFQQADRLSSELPIHSYSNLQANSVLPHNGDSGLQATSMYPNYGSLAQGIPALHNNGLSNFQTAPMLPAIGPQMTMQPSHQQFEQQFYNYFSPHRNRSGTLNIQNYNSNSFNRPRVSSNDTYRNRRHGSMGNAQYNDGRNFTPRQSPPHPNMEPVYFLNRQSNQGQRLSSDPVRGSFAPRVIFDPRSVEQNNERFYAANLPAKPPQPLSIKHNSSDGSWQSPNSSRTVRDFTYSRVASSSREQVAGNHNIDGGFYGGLPLIVNSNGASLFRYIPSRTIAPREEQRLRTIHIDGVDEETMFLSHELKAMMSQCGTVEQITFLSRRNVFVTFLEESSVQRAIQQWDLFVTPFGDTMIVEVPRVSRQSPHDRRTTNNSRNFGSRPSYDGSPRRSSFRKQTQQAPSPRNISRQSSGELTTSFEEQLPLTQRFNPILANIPQHQTAPSIAEDVLAPKQKGNLLEKVKTDQGGMHPDSPNQKENQQYSGQDLSLNEPKKSKGKSQRKNSKHYSSKRTTPAHTPTKPHSVTNFDLEDNDATALNTVGQTENIPLAEKPLPCKKTLHQGKKKNNKSSFSDGGQTQVSVSRSDSFTTEASDIAKSLSTIGLSESSFIQSSNTSFSTNSSRKQSIDNLEINNTRVGLDNVSIFDQSQRQCNALHQAKKPSSEESQEKNSVLDEVKQIDSENSHTKNNDQGHSKKNSNSSMNSKSSIRRADLNRASSDNVHNMSPDGKQISVLVDIANKTPRSSRHNNKLSVNLDHLQLTRHDDSHKISIHTGLLHKTPQSCGKIDSASAAYSTPINVDDKMEWPSLQPARSPVSSIADGKRPPPPTPSFYNFDYKIANKDKLVTSTTSQAYMVQPNAYSLGVTRTLGNRLWPFVKEFRCK